MARTDALAVEGLQASLNRAAAYREAGADECLDYHPYERKLDELFAKGRGDCPAWSDLDLRYL